MSELQKLQSTLFEQNSVGDVKFYPGESRDATVEDMAREMNAFLADLKAGNATPASD